MAGLYLHIPFCEHKCIYCDFYSIENMKGMESFLDALHREIQFYASYGKGESFETVFFGGGTPSLLRPSQLEGILDRLHLAFAIAPDAEITLETNPGTVDAEKLGCFRELGINRLSVGIQSFHEDDLRFLTRIHDGEMARECVRSARKAGFVNIAVDLIFSLPGQTLERWQSNLHQALELEPTHISAYSLIVEPNTPLARMVASRQVTPLPEEADAELYEWTMSALARAGFEHYEVSNYAKPGYRSRHNYNYWNHTNYLGFGPSAHSLWMDSRSHASPGGNSGPSARRWWNIANLNAYIERLANNEPPVVDQEVLDASTLIEEEILLGLRSDGLDLERLRFWYDVDVDALRAQVLDPFVMEGVARYDENRFRLTPRGYLLCDSICQRLTREFPVRPEMIPV